MRGRTRSQLSLVCLSPEGDENVKFSSALRSRLIPGLEGGCGLSRSRGGGGPGVDAHQVNKMVRPLNPTRLMWESQKKQDRVSTTAPTR